MKAKYIKHYKNKDKVMWHSFYWKNSKFVYVKISNGCIIFDF